MPGTMHSLGYGLKLSRLYVKYYSWSRSLTLISTDKLLMFMFIIIIFKIVLPHRLSRFKVWGGQAKYRNSYNLISV